MSALGVFSIGDGPRRVGVKVGKEVAEAGMVSTLLEGGSLSQLLEAGPDAWGEVLANVDRALPDLPRVPMTEVTMHLPCPIGDYVDFYSSLYHATRVGRIFRPEGDPLPSSWRHLPIGYHGRAGTIVVDGTPVKRPHGQRGPGDYGPSQRLDFELEIGFLTGTGPGLGEPIPVTDAERYIFGLVLVNDWSARDIQAFEYQPLGPFLGKSFATTISPWVVPLADLEVQRIEPPVQEPTPLPHLTPAGRGLDIALEVLVNDTVVTRSNTSFLYWTMAQQLAHATSNGATIRAGDLFASGTISGPTDDSLGCMLEMGGSYLEDGDEVVLRSELLGSCAGVIS
ncbi:MAG TPA: fumarylacetoacetate hydrolase family protein [Acidimicrobiia bacterium]|nr:fumarylacetoacetate hydrolase family protein [Acidimicrobiia bacterium]